MASLEQLKEFSKVGREMGLTGGELSSFVSERCQAVERDKRDRETRELEREARDKEFLAQEKEREDREKERVAREKEREHELRLAQLRKEGGDNVPQVGGIKLDVGKFNDAHDKFDAYITKFEMIMSSQRVNDDLWVLHLISNLTGKALDVVNRMGADDRQNYAVVKSELMEFYNLTEEGYRRNFRAARPFKFERPKQFATRMKSHFDNWVGAAKIDNSREALEDLVLREQFMIDCPKDVARFVRERKCNSFNECVQCAETYVSAHGSHVFCSGQKQEKARSDTKTSRSPSSQVVKNTSSHNNTKVWKGEGSKQFTQKKGCYVCGSPKHMKRECPILSKSMAAQGMVLVGDDEVHDVDIRDGDSASLNEVGRSQVVGTLRSDDRHPNRNSRSLGRVETSAGCAMMGDRVIEMQSESGERIETLGMAYDEITAMMNDMPIVSGRLMPENKPVSVLKDSGCSTSVVRTSLVDESQFTGEYRLHHLIDGTMRWFPRAKVVVDSPYFSGELLVSCMPNCLCDVIIGNNVKGAREPNDPDLNWVPRTEGLSDVGCPNVVSGSETSSPRSELELPCANVSEVSSPCPEIDIVSEDVDFELMAVQTRAQQKAGVKTTRDLKVKDSGVKVNSKEFLLEQKSDPTLKPLWNKVDDKESKSKFLFMSEKNCLCRQERDVKNPNVGVGPKLVVVPKTHRSEVMRVAHDSLFGGHLGINNTLSKVKTQFFWPGMTEDVANFCRSCDVCQKTVNKGSVPKATLGRLPLVGVPFERIAIDLMGPFLPSARGHTHILTIVDYATRYVEAVPLKSISTVDVAEALVTVYSRVGVPREVMSDLGTQFVSDLMRKVSQLLSVKQITSSRYHPMCNGLVERYNAVVKTALKRLCSEEPRQWDRYLPALLFALREAPSSSLGFSPFELLYGRHVRGPVAILKELWTEEDLGEDTKNEYEYVIDLRKRLVESWQLAQDTLKSSAKRYKGYYDRRAKKRTLKVGDEVLILLPTVHNKLLVEWQGPFKVVATKFDYDYVVDVKGVMKTFHINLLRRYVRRNEEIASSCFDVGVCGMEAEVDADVEVFDECARDVPDMPCAVQQEFVGNIQVDEKLGDECMNEVQELLCEYQDIFTDVPKKTSVAECKIHLTSDEPIRSPPYRVPQAVEGEIMKEVESMLKLGVIEPSDSPYAHPIVMVRKPDGSNRFCIDFRRLNKITVFDPEPMPNQQDLFASLAKSKYFSKIDLTKGYWQIPMKESDKPKTAFLTPGGQFQFRYMPFGLVTAGAQFTRMMRQVLKGIPNVVNYIDDILVYTETWEEHLKTIERVLCSLREANLAARPSKCYMGFSSIDFLGHELGDGTIHTSKRLTQKAVDAPRPETKKQVRSFLGLTGYYRDYIPGYSDLALPLTNLTRKGSPTKVDWGLEEERAFQKLKECLVSPPVLRLPDFDRIFMLKVDASDTGLGAVLMQEWDGEEFPIAYASKKLLPREQRYSTVEKECLSIVWAVRKFEYFLYGREFEIHTDHKPLLYIQSKKLTNKRIMRWSMFLQEYRFRLVSVKGSENKAADLMSRLV